MTKFKTNKKALAFKGAAVLIIAALLALVFTACKQPAGAKSDGDSSGGGHTEPNYVKVSYCGLEDYLKDEALEGEVNYIEVIGDIPATHFKSTSAAEPGELGKKIKSFPNKKVALKIKKYPTDLTDMESCFAMCENLISLANLPEGNITSMKGCFSNCKNLTRVPNIPEGVENMAGCFAIATSLIIGPEIPDSVKKMSACFMWCGALKEVRLKCNYNPNEIGGQKAFSSAFLGCNALKDGGIKVPSGQLAVYTEDAAIKTMFDDTCDVEVQKKKFAEYTP